MCYLVPPIITPDILHNIAVHEIRFQINSQEENKSQEKQLSISIKKNFYGNEEDFLQLGFKFSRS